jgi:glycosylphosphatidylinositol deacylase
VMLLGHSMGGVVARLAATTASANSISLVLTMATPHTIAPAPLDHSTESIYSAIASHQSGRPEPLLVSVCGGLSDTQVVSDTCALSDLHPGDGFTVFTSGLPGAWTGVDHQAMVWCHQIRWAVARALLESASMAHRGARLLRLKRWLSDDRADRRSVSSAEMTKTRVTNEHMTLVVRWDSSDLPQISYCPVRGSCRDIEGRVSRIPWLRDESRPFPLVGEGVSKDDLALAINLDLGEASGHVEIGAEVLAGGHTARARKVEGGDWSVGASYRFST